MKQTLKDHFSWREGLRRTFPYTTVETICFFQTGPYNFHWIRIFILSSFVSKPICRLFFIISPLVTLQTFVSKTYVFLVVLTSCSELNSCLEGTESMCHKTDMQNHLGLVWVNESLPRSLLFTVLRVKAASFPLCLWEWITLRSYKMLWHVLATCWATESKSNHTRFS